MKRFLAMILTLAMVMSMLPVGALAAEYTDGSTAAAETGVTATKTVSGPDENGQYTITLSVTGTSEDVTDTQQLPADIVLVVDTSTSMDDTVRNSVCGGVCVERSIYGGTYWRCTVCNHTYQSETTTCTEETNRLGVAKLAAKQFIGGLLENEGVQIGLYDFSGSNRTNVALTSDETTLMGAIDDMDMPSWGDGTNYTLGLTGAQNILSSSTKDQKFVVFISDGDPNGGNGRDVATQLKNAGVTIITVGIDIGTSTATALRNISSTDEDGDALYYAASSSGDSSTALDAILAQIQKLIEDTIHAGSNGVMVDIVNTDDFTLVEGSASAELTAGENGTMTWNIGDITKDTKSVSFKVTPNEGSFGTLHTNDNVTLTFDSTVLDEQVTYSKDAIGDPTVYIAPPAITVTADSNEKPYDGTALTDNGFTVVGAPEGYTVTAVVEGSQTDAGSATNTVTSVTVTNPDGVDVTELFAEYITEVDGTLTVNKRTINLSSESATQEYNGKALTRPTVTMTGDGWAEGEGATVKATGSQTTPGSCTNTIVCDLDDNTKAENYNIILDQGTLIVTNRSAKYEITVVSNSGEATYDGEEHTVSDFEKLTFEVEGNSYTVEGLSASVSGTNAGTYTNEITGTAVVKDAEGNDVTDQFIVNQTNGTLAINKRNVTLTSATAEKKYDGEVLTAKNVTVSGEGWADGEGAEYDVTGSQKVVGSSANTFTYTLNEGTNADNYNIAKVEGQLTVTDRDAKYEITVVANSDTQTYDGKEHAVSGIVSDTFTVDGNTYTVEGLSASAAGTDAGSYTANVEGTAIVRDEDGTDVTSQFAVTTQAGALTINKRTLVMTSASDEKEYDGEPLTNKTVTVTGEGFVDGEGAVYDVTGTRTLVGTAENSFTYTLNEGTKAENYSISTAVGSLTVKSRTAKYEITVEANSGEEKYDGAEKTVSGFKTLTFEVEGNTYTVEGLTAEGKLTNAGETAVAISGTPVVKDAEGNVVTDEFAVSTVNGKLVIIKRAVTLTSADDSKEYDGTPLTNDEVNVSGDGFAQGEGATYTVTGSQTLAGSSDNVFTYALNEGTNADNYEITTEFGTLTIGDRTEKYEITVEANSGEYLYDGTEKKAEGFKTLTYDFEVGEEKVTYTVEGLSASISATDAGTHTVKVNGEAVVKDAAGNDVTAQFIVKTVDGTLTINKRNVTLRSATDSKPYDGTPLTNKEVTVSGDGFAEGEGATYDVTGSQLTVGNSANEFTYELNEGTKADNYTITVTPGQLTVTDRDAKYEINVVANSKTEKYDGTEKSVSGFETLTFTVDGQTYTVSGLEASAVATDAGSCAASVTGTAVVTDAYDNDVTSQFAVRTTAGTLTITKREVTLTSATDEKEYDGNALTNDDITVEGDGWAKGEGAAYNVTGSQTLVGSSENTFSYELKEGTKADNYTVTTQNGTLTVTNRNAKYSIEVVAKNDSKMYDGEAMTVDGFETLTFEVKGNIYTVSGLTAATTETDAGEYPVNIVGTPVVKDAELNDVTDQFAVSTVNGKLTITKRAVTLTSASDEKEYDGTALTNDEVTVTGDGFVGLEGATYNVTGSQTLKGESDNTFTYTLNEGTNADNYEITTEYGMLRVGDRTEKYEITVVANSGSKPYDGEAMTVEGFTEPLKYTFTTEEGKSATFTVEGLSASATATDAGTYTVEVKGEAVVKDAEGYDVTEQFKVNLVNGQLVINKRQVTLTSATASKPYDGTALTNDHIDEGDVSFAEGEGATYVVEGSQTVVGSSENTFTYTLNEGTKAANYEIETKFGTLTVYNRDADYVITVTANSGEFLYDGTEKTVEGLVNTVEDGSVKVVLEENGLTYYVYNLTAKATGTDAGEYNVNVTGEPIVKDSNGEDVTSEFRVLNEKGLLKINERNVTLTSATAQKTYDGKVLTNKNVTVSGDGFVEGEGASYDVTGSRLLVGESENTFTYTLNEGTEAENYNINVVFGKLTVIDREDPYVITVEANSGEFLYDGTEKTVSGFKTLTFIVEENEYTVEGLTAEAAETNAGEYVVEITGDAVVKDAQKNVVTDQFDVELINGSMVINRATVTVTVDENQRKVIGNEDPELTATITGLAEGDEESLISYTLTREAGENVGTYDLTVSGEEVQGNYNVIYVNGTFRITAGELTLNNKDHMRYMQGYPDGTFMPEQNMTRAEVAVMFCRLLNNSMSIDSDAKSPFSDVKEGDWYYEEVCFMAENGILKGYPDGTFGPWEPITRAEFATICTRFDVARQTEAVVLAEEFPDVTKRDWFYDYVMTAAGNGWVGGFPNGNFEPNDYITRSQVVTVVNRVLERIPDEAYIDNAVATGAEDFRTYTDVADNWAYYNIYEASVAHDYNKTETEDETVKENWERHWLDLYTVAYHISGTTPDVASVFDATYKVGQKVDLPTAEDVAEMHNTVFLGWALTENATTPMDEYIVDADDSFVSENGVDHQIIHLYAVWG